MYLEHFKVHIRGGILAKKSAGGSSRIINIVATLTRIRIDSVVDEHKMIETSKSGMRKKEAGYLWCKFSGNL